MEAGPFIQTVSGRRVNPFAPDAAEFDIDDIARSLANQCRFGGHCRAFYSVAQHSCQLADLVEQNGGDPSEALWALLHDATEAYLVDLPHPLKHRSELGRIYREAEAAVQEAICERFGLPPEPPALKSLDRALLATERRALSEVAWHWPELDGVEPLELDIEPWLPDRAAGEFLQRFQRLTRLRDTATARA